MSDGVAVDWDSGQSPEDLVAKFDRFERVLEDNLESAMNTVVTKIAADASERAPYETGWLSSNIRGVVMGWANDVLKAMVGTSVYYAEFQERGTRYMAANPYLGPALDDNEQWAYEQFENAVEESVQQVF